MQASLPSRRSRWHPLGVAIGGVVVVAAVVAAMLIWHAFGQLVAARALGDSTASWQWFHRSGSTVCLGCVHYDPAAYGAAGNALVAGAGVLATQVLALLTLPILAHTSRDHVGTRATLALLAAVCIVGDLCRELVNALRSGASITSHELPGSAGYLASWWGVGPSKALMAVAAIAAAVAVAELWWLVAAWRRSGRGRTAYGSVGFGMARYGR